MDTGQHASTSAKACDLCGAAAPYEPLEIAGRDFGANFPHVCTACQAKQEREAEARRQAAIREERERRIEALIPPRIRRTDIAHQEFNANAWKVIERWTPHSGRWLVMVGEGGLCKTRMMGLHAARLIRQGFDVAWTTSIGLQAAAIREHDPDPAERARARASLAHWKACDVLALDDLGKEAGDGKEAFAVKAERHLFEILDHRYAHELPVMLSCNTHPAEMLVAGLFSKDRGAPLVGRILEAAGEVYLLSAEPRQLEF
jgi:DNA replication protein DnaC